MKVSKILFAATLALVSAAPCHANSLLTNGSFEAQEVVSNNGTWQVYTSLTGWRLGGQYIEIQKNGLFGSNPIDHATDGTNWLELDYPGNTPQIMQDITTNAAANYVLTFDYSPRPGFGDQELGIYWNGNMIGSVGGSGSAYHLNWQTYTFTFSGIAGLNTLGFGSLKNFNDITAAGGNLLDRVSLTSTSQAVPEPATSMLVGAGLLAAYRKRRRASLG